MKPYYEEDGIVIYHGDCREILPRVLADAMISDPVWPNASPKIIGHERPYELFDEFITAVPESIKRLVIHMGCNSDPRILASVPQRWPFFRTCWLEYASPHYTGRVLNGSDIAYVFGEPVAFAPGRQTIPGRSPKAQPGQTWKSHPCSRAESFVVWLVTWFSDHGETIVDPFMGSGTTLAAAKRLHRKAIGIEIAEEHCETAVNRLAQGALPLEIGA